MQNSFKFFKSYPPSFKFWGPKTLRVRCALRLIHHYEHKNKKTFFVKPGSLVSNVHLQRQDLLQNGRRPLPDQHPVWPLSPCYGSARTKTWGPQEKKVPGTDWSQTSKPAAEYRNWGIDFQTFSLLVMRVFLEISMNVTWFGDPSLLQARKPSYQDTTTSNSWPPFGFIGSYLSPFFSCTWTNLF